MLIENFFTKFLCQSVYKRTTRLSCSKIQYSNTPTCSPCLTCLMPYVLLCLTCSRASRALRLTCSRASRASCFTCFRTLSASCLTYFRTPRASLASGVSSLTYSCASLATLTSFWSFSYLSFFQSGL